MNATNLYNYLISHRHPIFLFGLFSFFFIPEISELIFNYSLSFPFMLIILIVPSIFLIQSSPKKRILTYLLVLALIIFIVIWNNFERSRNIENVAYIFLFVYFSFITFFLFMDLLRSKEITTSVIIGAFAGYFMIGVMFFFIFGFLDGYFTDTTSVDLIEENGIQDMVYFSFITLTTIGYGDFSPTSSLGQKIAILEGLIGQFYIAIVMAILVGKFITSDNK